MGDQRVQEQAATADGGFREASRRHQLVVIRVLCGVLAVLAFTSAAGLTLPVVPADGPAFSAPDRITVTTADGTEVELERDGVPRSRLALLEGGEQVTALLQIDPVSHADGRVPVVSPGLGDTLTERFVARVSGPDDDASGADEQTLRDGTRRYVPRGTGLPDFSDDQLDAGAVEAAGLTVTTDDPSVVAMTPDYRSGADGPQRWVVAFDFAEMHAAGNTNLRFPLAWYEDGPVVPAIRAVAPWLGVALLGLAVFLPRLARSPRSHNLRSSAV